MSNFRCTEWMKFDTFTWRNLFFFKKKKKKNVEIPSIEFFVNSSKIPFIDWLDVSISCTQTTTDNVFCVRKRPLHRPSRPDEQKGSGNNLAHTGRGGRRLFAKKLRVRGWRLSACTRVAPTVPAGSISSFDIRTHAVFNQRIDTPRQVIATPTPSPDHLHLPDIFVFYANYFADKCKPKLLLFENS